MAIEIPNALQSFGSVLGADGSKVSGAGFVSARTGKGVYTLTLDAAAPAAESSILGTLREGAVSASEIVIGHTSDTVKTVSTGDAGAAADHNFDFLVLRAPHGT